MGTGPAGAPVSGPGNLTNTRTTCPTWVTSHRSSDTCSTTGPGDAALSPREHVHHAAPGAPTGPPLPRRVPCCPRRSLRPCRGSLTGTLVPEPAASGSGATTPWAGSGTEHCPTVDSRTGPGGSGPVRTSGFCPVVTALERSRGPGNVSCLTLTRVMPPGNRTCHNNVVYQVSGSNQVRCPERFCSVLLWSRWCPQGQSGLNLYCCVKKDHI